VLPQCPIAGNATVTPLEGDISRTVRVYGLLNTQTTVRQFIVCIGRGTANATPSHNRGKRDCGLSCINRTQKKPEIHLLCL